MTIMMSSGRRRLRPTSWSKNVNKKWRPKRCVWYRLSSVQTKERKKRLRPFLCYAVPPWCTNNIVPISLSRVCERLLCYHIGQSWEFILEFTVKGKHFWHTHLLVGTLWGVPDAPLVVVHHDTLLKQSTVASNAHFHSWHLTSVGSGHYWADIFLLCEASISVM